jgi:hypothetical protein
MMMMMKIPFSTFIFRVSFSAFLINFPSYFSFVLVNVPSGDERGCENSVLHDGDVIFVAMEA